LRLGYEEDTVVGDGDFSEIINYHLVESLGSEGGADDVGDGHGGTD
jgi:hypothetical protein